MSQHAQSTVNPQSQDNKRKIHRWLMDEGWQVGEERRDEFTWVLAGTDKLGKKILIMQPKDKTDVVIIQAGVITDDNIRQHLSGMDVHKRNAFYFDLQYALLQMGVEYANVGDPFELIIASQRIYSDALARDRFIQRVIQVRNAQVMILLKILSLMNQPPVVPTERPPIGFHSPE